MDAEKRNNMKEVIEWVICIVIAVVLALLVRHFIGTPTVVRQGSMETTLIQGDRLILNRWAITTHEEIKRGEIITFEAPSITETSNFNKDNPVAIYNNEPQGILGKFMYYVLEVGKTSYIKRVVAIGGDHILIEDGKVYLNGEELKEDYLPEGVETPRMGGVFYDLTVPEGYIFAMGDNRPGSKDCRMFGCIPIEKVESKASIRFWPFNKFGKV